MKRDFALTLGLTLACTATPIGLDDEAGVTTAMDDANESSGATTDESGSTTETSESTSDDSGPFFVPEYDVMDEGCDSFAQDCPPGEKCVPYASDGDFWNANKCVPILGDQQPGEACTWGGIVEATDDCDANSICWDVMDVDGERIGECMAFCQGSADAPECPPGYQCFFNGGSTINLCISDCDPLLQDCGDGLSCIWANNGFNCIFTSGEFPTGEPCELGTDCAPGNLCADAATLPNCAGSSCCTAYCDLTLGDAGCMAQPGTVCTAFFEEGTAPPGYENVGLCVLPP